MQLLFSLHSLGFLGIVLGGILVHAVWKWGSGEIPIGLYSYFFQVNRKSTALMVLSALGGLATAILTGTISDLQDGAHVLAAWGIGFASDSMFNKAKDKEAS